MAHVVLVYRQGSMAFPYTYVAVHMGAVVCDTKELADSAEKRLCSRGWNVNRFHNTRTVTTEEELNEAVDLFKNWSESEEETIHHPRPA